MTKQRTVLWPWQKAAGDMIDAQAAVYLNHGMGAGKTLTTIAAGRQLRVMLVICPVSVGPSWARHFAEHDPDRVVARAWAGTASARIQSIQTAVDTCRRQSGRLAIVINYDSFWRPLVFKAIEKALAAGDAGGMIVADEAHRVKSAGSKASRHLYLLARHFPHIKRVCLSGTPCPKDPLDWYGQMRFLDATIFGTNYAAFSGKYAIPHPKFPGSAIGFRNQDELAALLAPIVHTVTTDAVLDLPEAVHARIDVELSPAEARYYKQMAAESVADLPSPSGEGREIPAPVIIQDEGLDDDGDESPAPRRVTAANALGRLLRLQQGCSGHAPDVDANGEPITGQAITLNGHRQFSSKGFAVAQWLEDLPHDEPVAVFALFRADLDQIRMAAVANGRKCLELSGSKRELEEWQAGSGGEVLAVQIRSGGVGVDLTRASRVAFMSLGHSYGDFEQSLARIRRPGQKSSRCLYTHFIATLPHQGAVAARVAATADELVYRTIQAKENVVDVVFDLIRETQGGSQYARGRTAGSLDAVIGARRDPRGDHPARREP